MYFTSIDQSKKLIELGIDKYTCDLIHRKRDCGDGYIIIVPRTNDGFLHNLNYFGERPDDIPCWSTGALINLLKPIDGNTYSINGTLDGGAIVEFEGVTNVVFQELTLFEAIFRMICWLKEYKYI